MVFFEGVATVTNQKSCGVHTLWAVLAPALKGAPKSQAVLNHDCRVWRGVLVEIFGARETGKGSLQAVQSCGDGSCCGKALAQCPSNVLSKMVNKLLLLGETRDCFCGDAL